MQRITLCSVYMLLSNELCFRVVTQALHSCHVKLIVLLINGNEVLTRLVSALVATAHAVAEVEGKSAPVWQLGHQECPEVLNTIGLGSAAYVNDHVAGLALLGIADVSFALEFVITD